MLTAVQKQRADGRDVAIGYVETHGRTETDALTDPSDFPMQTLPVTLKPRETRVQELGMAVPAAVIFGLIFGGMLAAFMLEKTKPQGGEWWGAIAFLSGLGLVALLFLIAAGYLFLAIFNPRVRLTVRSDRVPPGGTLELAWETPRRAYVIRQLLLQLECKEIGPPPPSTGRVRNEERTLALIQIGQARSHAAIQAGRVSVRIPADARPSAPDASPCVRWIIHVKGQVRCWPDLHDQFEITVG